jgi:hypothetical protein
MLSRGLMDIAFLPCAVLAGARSFTAVAG